MPESRTLQIATAAAGVDLTPAQKRFNTLIRQLEQARRTLAEWHSGIPLYQQLHLRKVGPLQAAHAVVYREWIVALDALYHQPGWSRAERDTISELVCDAAGELLHGNEDDASMRALFDKHAAVDYDTEKAQDLQEMKRLAEAMTGIDLGDSADIRSNDELFQRLQHGFAADAESRAQADADPAACQSARRSAQQPPRRMTAAQKRREAEAQLATQSVREIYRKLASALHPDREPYEKQRAAKTVLMQQANAAYAANDLLTLLELQLQIEQVDVAGIGNVSAARLKHYNKVLAEQLDELKAEIEHTEIKFCIDFDLGPAAGLKPVQLPLVVEQEVRRVTGATARSKQEIRLFTNKTATRQWLKRQRKLLDADVEFGGGFYY